MNIREFLGYALGTAFVLALTGLAVGAIAVVVTALPMILLVFPVSAGLLALFIGIGYLRHRRRRNRQPRNRHDPR